MVEVAITQQQRAGIQSTASECAADSGRRCSECVFESAIVQPSLRAKVRSSAGRTTRYGTIRAAIVPISTAPPEPTGP